MTERAGSSKELDDDGAGPPGRAEGVTLLSLIRSLQAKDISGKSLNAADRRRVVEYLGAEVRSAEQRRLKFDWFQRSILKVGTSGSNVLVAGTILHNGSFLAKLTDPVQSPGWVGRRYKAVVSFASRPELWQHARLYVRKLTNTTDKLGRIQRLQPLISSGAIRFSRRHVTLLDQLRQFPMAPTTMGPMPSR